MAMLPPNLRAQLFVEQQGIQRQLDAEDAVAVLVTDTDSLEAVAEPIVGTVVVNFPARRRLTSRSGWPGTDGGDAA